MAFPKQQLSALASQLEQLHNSILVDEKTTGVTIEKHSPGNGIIYTRLRAAKGQALSNGKRTMSLKAEDVEEWEQKIHARNQKAKVAQCLRLVQQAAEVAEMIDWDDEAIAAVVKESNSFTISPTDSVVSETTARKPKQKISYIYKDGPGATMINRRVHAIAEDRPASGRWYSPAFCGARPRPGTWGWSTCDSSELSCPKCYDKVKALS
jgi:hypothetical protein